MRDITYTGDIIKTNDRMQVFGWAYIAMTPDGQVVVDKQGDFIDDPEELEKAVYEYVHKSRVGGEMHLRRHEGDVSIPFKASDLIESIVFTPDKIAKMGLTGVMPVGWWVGYQVHDRRVWNLIKSGVYRQFSIHGSGKRTEVDLEKSDPDQGDVHIDAIMNERIARKRKKGKKGRGY